MYSLILIKCYVILIFGLILLLIIENVMYCLCELCFDTGKLVIWIFFFFFRQGVNDRKDCPRVRLLEESQILSTTLKSQIKSKIIKS